MQVKSFEYVSKSSILVVILDNNGGKYVAQRAVYPCAFKLVLPRNVNHNLQLFVASGVKYSFAKKSYSLCKNVQSPCQSSHFKTSQLKHLKEDRSKTIMCNPNSVKQRIFLNSIPFWLKEHEFCVN